ncbi:TPA: hypothetical protein ACX6RX_003172 [Photobacterium damselae]
MATSEVAGGHLIPNNLVRCYRALKMTCKLLNAMGKEIPNRPILSSELIELGVKDAFSAGHISSVEHDDMDFLASDIVQYYSDSDDGYSLAKSLDDRSIWNVDSNFVDDMDSIINCIGAALRKAERDWETIYKPVPPFENGVKLVVVSFAGFKQNETWGVIDGISKHLAATYLVRMADTPIDDPSNTRRLIRFEDVVLAEEAV